MVNVPNLAYLYLFHIIIPLPGLALFYPPQKTQGVLLGFTHLKKIQNL